MRNEFITKTNDQCPVCGEYAVSMFEDDLLIEDHVNNQNTYIKHRYVKCDCGFNYMRPQDLDTNSANIKDGKLRMLNEAKQHGN